LFEAMQLGRRLFQLGVALEEHGNMGVHPEGLDHLFPLSPGEFRGAAPGEIAGDLDVQPGSSGRLL
jgi:hypothetical protein